MSPISTGKPLDRRQRKTRLAIQNALLVLLREKPIERITVSELACAADVNRKTFYNHYTSLVDVRTDLERQHIDQVMSFLKEAPTAELRADPHFFICHLVKEISLHHDHTKLVFDSGEQFYMAERFKEVALPALSEVAVAHSKHPEYLPYVIDFMVNGLVCLLENWVRSSEPVSHEEFADIAVKLIRSACVILEFDDSPILKTEN